jgi:hypothetical protein
MKDRGALPEDVEHIARLEELLRERREAVEHLENDYRSYENAMMDCETVFARLASGQGVARPESATSLLGNSGGKRMRKDGLAVSGRKLPHVIEPTTNARKNRTPV